MVRLGSAGLDFLCFQLGLYTERERPPLSHTVMSISNLLLMAWDKRIARCFGIEFLNIYKLLHNPNHHGARFSVLTITIVVYRELVPENVDQQQWESLQYLVFSLLVLIQRKQKATLSQYTNWEEGISRGFKDLEAIFRGLASVHKATKDTIGVLMSSIEALLENPLNHSGVNAAPWSNAIWITLSVLILNWKTGLQISISPWIAIHLAICTISFRFTNECIARVTLEYK